MKKKKKNLILVIFIAVILPLLTSCGTLSIEYVSIISSDDIHDFPELNYFSESSDGEYITVDSFWFQKVAEYKIEMEKLKEIIKRNEKELNEKK